MAATGVSAQVAAPPRFNPKAPENGQVLSSFSYASVEAVLNGIGARHQRAGTPARPALRVTLPNSPKEAVLVFGSCNSDASACKALSIQAYWTRIAQSPPERTAAAIAGFNQRYSFAKAFVTGDGRPALQRYLTADYGFIRGDLAVNLLVFGSQTDLFAANVVKMLETAKK
jgi:hypothetical protein